MHARCKHPTPQTPHNATPFEGYQRVLEAAKRGLWHLGRLECSARAVQLFWPFGHTKHPMYNVAQVVHTKCILLSISHVILA